MSDQPRDALVAFPGTAYDLVVIGSSAGGLKALIHVLAALPANFPAAITIVQHISPNYPSQMAEILRRRIQLMAKQVEEGDVLRPANVYVAPPDYHVLVGVDGVLHLSHDAIVQYVRPSANLLFKSAATVFGKRLICIILTGTGSDGAVGAQAVKQAGGKIIVQDETTSEFFGMPSAAIATGDVDLVLPLGEIAGAVLALVASKAIHDQSI